MSSRTFRMTNIVDTDVLTRMIVKAVKDRRNVKGDSFATIAEFDMILSDPLTVIGGHPEITRYIVTTLLGTDCSDCAGCTDFQIWNRSSGKSEVVAYFRRDDSAVSDDCFDCDDYTVRNIYTTCN